MANRTFVRLGALTGACAAFGVAAAVVRAVYWASVIPAVGPVPPCRACAPGRQIQTSDQRERLPQFRAGARTGSGAVAAANRVPRRRGRRRGRYPFSQCKYSCAIASNCAAISENSRFKSSVFTANRFPLTLKSASG